MNELKRILTNAGIKNTLLESQLDEYGGPMDLEEAQFIVKASRDWLDHKRQLEQFKTTGDYDADFQRKENLEEEMAHIRGILEEHQRMHGYGSVNEMFQTAKNIVLDAQKSESVEETAYELSLDSDRPIKIQGVKGVKSKDFVKRFKNMAAYEKWLDRFDDDVEVSHVMNEDDEGDEAELNVNDIVVVDYPNRYEGMTGELVDFSPSGSFITVAFKDGQSAYMHLDDVRAATDNEAEAYEMGDENDWDEDFEEGLNNKFTQFKDEKAFENFDKFLTQSLSENNSALEQAARQNVENHIGDVVTGDDDPETIGEEVYVLAFDGVVDAGGSPEQGRKIAAMIRDEFTGVHETAGVGIYDPRSNKTADVGPDTLRKNAAKFGFKVSKGGVPPKVSKNSFQEDEDNRANDEDIWALITNKMTVRTGPDDAPELAYYSISPKKVAVQYYDDFSVPEAIFAGPSWDKLGMSKVEFVQWLEANGVRKMKKPKPYKSSPSYYD